MTSMRDLFIRTISHGSPTRQRRGGRPEFQIRKPNLAGALPPSESHPARSVAEQRLKPTSGRLQHPASLIMHLRGDAGMTGGVHRGPSPEPALGRSRLPMGRRRRPPAGPARLHGGGGSQSPAAQPLWPAAGGSRTPCTNWVTEQMLIFS